MNREKLSYLARNLIIAAGCVCITLAAVSAAPAILSWGFLILVFCATIVAPRLALELPRTRFAISFSDAAVFFAFLYYGGPAAVLVAALEVLAGCIYLRSKGFEFGRLMIPANVAINAVSVSLTYLVWLNLPPLPSVLPEAGSSQHLLSTVLCLAIFHFLASSTLAAILQSLVDGSNLLTLWRRDFFASSLTQIVGAGTAAVVYKIVNFGDIVTGVIGFLALALAYFSYRQSISKVGDAILQAEAAEREKAAAERQRRVEAETHAAQLAATLEKEEMANVALRKSEKDLQHAALFDSLTDLPNRKNFGDMLRRLIADYSGDPSAAFHVLFLDIRKFKNINDSLGHTLGDKVLQVAARRFVRMLKSGDMVARIGGDEFAVILKDVATVGKAQKVARRLRDNISHPFSLGGNRISISVNIGVAPCDAEYTSPEEVLRDADIAMHYAKEKSTGVAIFTKDLRVRFLERVRYETDLRHALDRGELSMSYQPLVCLSDGSLLGFEALLRWNHSEVGNIPPNKFIPIAEESGLIMPITRWILENTCKQIAIWQTIGADFKDIIVSVNISGKHLSNDDLIDDVENALAIARISPSSLKLEITESAAMENAEHTIGVLNRLKQLGVQLSIDDFGTGYSSLSYLHRLPIDTLKIDRSFVYSVGESGENSEILQTIISLAKSLRKKVIAEGIETEAQLTLLQNLGCDYGQGYLLARPLTKENAEKGLYQRQNWLPANISGAVEQVSDSVRVDESVPAS